MTAASNKGFVRTQGESPTDNVVKLGSTCSRQRCDCQAVSVAQIMSMPMLGGPGTTQLHLQTSWRSPAPFSVGLLRGHSRKSSRYRCAADSNGSKNQNASQKLADDVMQRLREAEKEAAELREQLAKAKAEAVVRASVYSAAYSQSTSTSKPASDNQDVTTYSLSCCWLVCCRLLLAQVCFIDWLWRACRRRGTQHCYRI